MMNQEQLNQLSYEIIGAAIEVHKEMGPGIYEEVYEECMKAELGLRGIRSQSQVSVPLFYKETKLNKEYRVDLLVENEIIVELKCVERLKSIHEVQLVTYLKLADKQLGLLMNFNVPQMIDGIKRKVNGF